MAAMTGASPINFSSMPESPHAQERFEPLGPRDTFDLVVIGGGINGVGIARDAAGRGLSVLLCEQDDLASGTSSASTKLIHGGLRYLEYREFNLVRKALAEREILLAAAPHIVRPLRFVMPHVPGLRPAWMIRAALFLYDHLGRREPLPASSSIDLASHEVGVPLLPGFRKAFVYSDAWVDDARLVVLNALDASGRGAEILTRTRCVAAERGAHRWLVTLESEPGIRRRVVARGLVNAAGPWVLDLLQRLIGTAPRHRLRMVKGSHIVVPRLFDHDHAYLLQNADKRITFAIPYEGAFTLIGTTEVAFRGDPSEAAISSDETAYLCAMTNRYFKRPIAPGNVVWSFSGVRPLLEDEARDSSAVTRDYLLEYDQGDAGTGVRAPLLTVFGGKITTYRKLAEEALDKLAAAFGADRSSRGVASRIRTHWTAGEPLPGGEMPGADFEAFAADFGRRHAWLPPSLAMRYARAYGTRAERLVAGAMCVADLGTAYGPGLHEAEVAYLVAHEWARTADDVLWRRSKLGLHAGKASVDTLAERLAGNVNGP